VRRLRHVLVLFAVTAMALALAPRDGLPRGGHRLHWQWPDITPTSRAVKIFLLSSPTSLMSARRTSSTAISRPRRSDRPQCRRQGDGAQQALRHHRGGPHAVVDMSISPASFASFTRHPRLRPVTERSSPALFPACWAAITPGYERADLFSQIIAQEAAKRQVAVADLWSATKLRLSLISTPQDRVPGFRPRR
jgi:hypothetical protein